MSGPYKLTGQCTKDIRQGHFVRACSQQIYEYRGKGKCLEAEKALVE